MGRHPEGYRLRPPKYKGGPWTVRFTLGDERPELSTGESDRSRAEKKAREIYADAVRGKLPSRADHRVTVERTASWIDELAIRETTRTTYKKYALYWVRDLRMLSDAAIASYVRRRLREVKAKTVRSELSALRSYIDWLVEVGILSERPTIPSIPKTATGKAWGQRRRTAAPELSPKEAEAILRKLPKRSPRDGFVIRARFVVAYETGLRPTTLDLIRCPEHYQPGGDRLRITLDVDKEGYEREVPLSPRAQREIGAVCPEDGLIFGAHRYDRFIRDAVKEALPASKAAVFTGQHFRSARATHWLESGAELPGVQHLLGHRHTSTTARYVRPSYRAAEQALKATSRRRR